MASRPHQYRDVDLPPKWGEWPDDAKVNYLSTATDRSNLLRMVGKLAGIPEDEIGEQSFLKNGLAHLIIALEELETGRGGSGE